MENDESSKEVMMLNAAASRFVAEVLLNPPAANEKLKAARHWYHENENAL